MSGNGPPPRRNPPASGYWGAESRRAAYQARAACRRWQQRWGGGEFSARQADKGLHPPPNSYTSPTYLNSAPNDTTPWKSLKGEGLTESNQLVGDRALDVSQGGAGSCHVHTFPRGEPEEERTTPLKEEVVSGLQAACVAGAKLLTETCRGEGYPLGYWPTIIPVARM